MEQLMTKYKYEQTPPIKNRYRGSIIAFDSQNRVLLLVLDEGDDKELIYEFPGGGLKEKELSVVGARREFEEECGAILDLDLLHKDKPYNRESILVGGRWLDARGKSNSESEDHIVEMTQSTKYYIIDADEQLKLSVKPAEKRYSKCVWLSIDEINELQRQHKLKMKIVDWRLINKVMRTRQDS